MTAGELAALIVAITGAIGAIFAGYRNLRGDKIKHEVEAAAAVLTGYTNLAQTLQTELDRMKREHNADRDAWVAERQKMRQEHSEELKQLREEHHNEMAQAYERIDELGTQLYILANRPKGARERETDQP